MSKDHNLLAVPDRPRAFAPPRKHKIASVFNFTTTGTTAEMMLYGVIGWDDCSGDAVCKAIKSSNASTIIVNINSPGGDVFDGTAIYNALKSHPANVVVNIEGLAASAASVIAMAGDTVNIGKNAYMMIHRSSTFAMGTSDDLRQAAVMTDKVDGAIAATYARITGKTSDEMMALMNGETWYVGQEAVDAGFCDGTLDDDDDEPAAIVAASALKAFAKVPSKLQALIDSKSNRPNAANRGGKPADKPAAKKDPTVQLKHITQAEREFRASASLQKHYRSEEDYVYERGRVLAVAEAAMRDNPSTPEPPATIPPAETPTMPTATSKKFDPDAIKATALKNFQNLPKAEQDTWIDANYYAREEVKKAKAKHDEPQEPEVHETWEQLEATWNDHWTRNFENCTNLFTDKKNYVASMKSIQKAEDRRTGVFR